MDIDNENSFTKVSYKFVEPVLDNLNIVYNSSNSKLLLWNKYQILVYDNKDTGLEYLRKILIPEYIHLVIASNDHVLCLDCVGNIHLTSLNLESKTPIYFEISNLSRDRGLKICVRNKEDHILSLKHEAKTYFLCLHKMSTDFPLEKKVLLLCNNEHWPLGEHSQEKYLLSSYSINRDNFDHLKILFNSEETFQSSYELVVMSVDMLKVYACLFSPKMCADKVTPVELYSCPAEICKMEIVDSGGLHLLIGLKMGTLIRLPLTNTSKPPDIVHLNTSLFKMLILKDSLIYSDGTTMWKAENTFSDLKLTQYFVKNIKDFVQCGDQIVCTTFNRFIYKFSIDDQSSYLIPKTDEYCSAEKLFNNSEYLNKLFEEIDKNNELVKKLEKEQHYITALSLSKRQDIINKAIQTTIAVFETYKEASTKECTLTEDIKEYFASNTWLFSVSITNTSIYKTLNSILSQLLDSVKIYITLSTPLQILKTTAIKMKEPLKTVNYLIPLNMTNETEINVNIKIVINIPGAYDKKKALTVLYRNDIILKSEYFIKTSQKEINTLKKTTEPTEDLIQKVSEIQYGSIFNFTNLSKLESEFNFYMKLPNDYEQIFKADRHSKDCLASKTLIMQQLSAEEFLKSKKHIIFTIGCERLKVKVHNDGFSNPLLKVTSRNPLVALNVRNFFARVIYKDYEHQEPGKEFIGYSFYTTTEVNIVCDTYAFPYFLG